MTDSPVNVRQGRAVPLGSSAPGPGSRRSRTPCFYDARSGNMPARHATSWAYAERVGVVATMGDK